MNAQTTRDYPARLERLQQRFSKWRQTHPPRSRIAASLWAAAVKAARRYGSYRTAQALRLNYDALRKRMAEAVDAPAVPPNDKSAAAFIELPPFVSTGSGAEASGSCECTLEWEDGGSGKRRLHFPRVAISDLAALCRSLPS